MERGRIEQEDANLRKQIKEIQDSTVSTHKVQQVCDLVASNLATLVVEEKGQILEALQIKVWIDGDEVTIHGVLPVPDLVNDNIVSQPL